MSKEEILVEIEKIDARLKEVFNKDIMVLNKEANELIKKREELTKQL